MTWDALAALGSILSTAILAVASVAAVLQLKHLQRANQLESYAHFLGELQSPELVEARIFLESLDVTDSRVLEAVHRIVKIGAHFQAVCRLLNLGILDDRLFIVYHWLVLGLWTQLQPIAYVLREREGAPRWLDIEYLVYRIKTNRSMLSLKRDFGASFLNDVASKSSLERIQARIDRL